MFQIDKILEQVRKDQENNQIKGNVLLLVKSIEQFSAMELLLKHKFVPHIISESAIAPRYTCSLLWQFVTVISSLLYSLGNYRSYYLRFCLSVAPFPAWVHFYKKIY